MSIIVREFDQTSAGNDAYSSFAVVVPGFYNASKTPSFDENGVLAFSSQADFKTTIGLVPAAQVLVTAATAAVSYAEMEGSDLVETGSYPLSAYIALGCGVYTIETGTFTAGYLKTTTKKYTATGITSAAELDASTRYALILPSAVGNDAVYAESQMGNQIAYELLGQGYTVLYKNLGAFTTGTTDAALTANSTAIKAMETYSTFWEPLKDKSAYDFRYIVTGLLRSTTTPTGSEIDMNSISNNIIKLATFINDDQYGDEVNHQGRGDCIALVDINEALYTQNMTQTSAFNQIITQLSVTSTITTPLVHASKYAAVFTPAVTYSDGIFDAYSDSTTASTFNNNTKFPASFHYLVCAAYSKDKGFSEWFANSGFTRGVSRYTVTGTTVNLGEQSVTTLQPRTTTKYTINSIDYTLTVAANIVRKYTRNSVTNYYIWGNRTAYALNADGLVASHFLNIRQLCCTLKKDIYEASNSLMFDPNSDLLYVRWCNKLRPELESMKGNEGIEDYYFERVATDVKGKMMANVTISPIEAVEDFDIGVYLTDTGETVVTED